MAGQSSSSNTTGGGGGGGGSGGRFMFVKDLEPNQKNFNMCVIVLDIGKPTQTKDGHEVRAIRVADKTGSINLSVWNDYGAVLREGDILRLSGCFTHIWKNSLQIKVSTKGQITKCGDFMMVFNELPDMSILSNLPSEHMKDIQEQSSSVKQQQQQQQSSSNPSHMSIK